MPLTNLNNIHLSAAQITAAKDALANLETTLEVINVVLQAEERKRYGSINEQNKLFVNKVQDYNKNQPTLRTNQVDWEEFEKDFNSRSLMEDLSSRLEKLSTKLLTAKILYDYDNYQASLVDYAYTNYMAGAGADGYETKLRDMKQFFNKNTTPTP